MSVCCECCVLSDRGLCDGLITRPEDSYRLWCVVVCDQETSRMRKLKPATGLSLSLSIYIYIFYAYEQITILTYLLNYSTEQSPS